MRSEDTMKRAVVSVASQEGNCDAVKRESVADILERDLNAVIQDWLSRVEEEPDLTCIPLRYEERTGHLPQLLHDMIARLRLDEGTKVPISVESRLLQVCIFLMLHKAVKRLDFKKLLPDVAIIADEVDAQLKQQSTAGSAQLSCIDLLSSCAQIILAVC
jgi:hypothetical protein